MVKTLEIEWKHLDKSGQTCDRCADTGAALREVVAALAKQCRSHGWSITLKEARLSESDISESNIILFNGKAIEEILSAAEVSESHCRSCGELIGDSSTSCRAVKVGNDTYEGIPPSLIRQAACAMAQCC